MSRIILPKVRMSFPSIFQKEEYSGKQGTKYAATFLLNKDDHAEQIENLETAIQEALIEKYGSQAKIPKILLKEEKRCLKDGDNAGYDGYDGHMSIKASNNARPSAMDLNKKQVTEDDNLFYSGCYVDASVDIWIMDNAHGKRVCANLYAVRFREDGEPFTGGGVPSDVEDDFEDLEPEALDETDI